MKVYIACDYKGIDVKSYLINYLNDKNINVLEIGLENKKVDDYETFAFKLGELVANDKDSKGILICGNGIGMSIAANKVKGIRCVRALSKEDAFEGRSHNDCNVLAIGANLDLKNIEEIVDTFLNSPSPDLERRIKRIKDIIKYENGEYNEL